MTSGGRQLVVRTRRVFDVPADSVWPLLCNSKMDHSSALLFKLGVPQPLECRLPAGQGVGAERECISDQGTIHQRILVWSPPAKMVFRMERLDVPSARGIDDIEESFDLEPSSRGVAVTRTTRVRVGRGFSLWKRFELRLGLKQVHRYVFRNWQRLARPGSPVVPTPELKLAQ